MQPHHPPVFFLADEDLRLGALVDQKIVERVKCRDQNIDYELRVRAQAVQVILKQALKRVEPPDNGHNILINLSENHGIQETLVHGGLALARLVLDQIVFDLICLPEQLQNDPNQYIPKQVIHDENEEDQVKCAEQVLVLQNLSSDFAPIQINSVD